MSSFHEWHPDFDLKPSKLTAAYLVLFHLISLFTLALLDVPFFVSVLLGLGILVSLYFFLRQVGRSECRVRQRVGEAWQIQFAGEPVKTYRLLGSSVVSRHLISLRFKPVGQRFALPTTVLITADRLGREDYRHLQVWLRWQNSDALMII